MTRYSVISRFTHRTPLTAVLTVAVGWALLPSQARGQTEDVVWRNAAGVTVSGNDLTKAAGTSWGNAGASSRQSLESDGFVEFTASGIAMLGLSKGDSNQDYTDIDFAVFVWSGTLYVYEAGSNRGSFGSVGSADKLRVEAADGVVRYRKNGVVFYTSTLAAGFPLLVDAALNSTGSTLTDVRLGRSSFSGLAGVTLAEQTLTKTAATGWNAGAASARRIVSGDGFVEFTSLETNKRRAGGLSNGDTNQTAADIDFAIVLNSEGTVEVQEGGVSRGQFGYYAAGDRFRVELQDGVVTYQRNGQLLYTSAVSPVMPLIADTALYDSGATLSDVVVSDLLWTTASGVTIAGGSLTKTGTVGWNAGAASTAALAAGDGYLEFTAEETNTTRACGLADQDSSYDPAEIDFAIQLQSTGEIRVHESGTLRGTFGTYAVGDRFRVEVRQGAVVYRKNGVVFYSSGVAPAYPLAVDAALYSPGATLGEVRLGNLAWKNEAGVSVWGHRLLDTATTGWGNSGAVSTVELAAGDGAVEFTATDTSTYRMLGLSNGDTDAYYTDIDFALSVGWGEVRVYEKGTERGAFGPFAVGDRMRVAVEGGVVKYRRNGALLYASAQAIVYPLLVDTALYDSGTALTGVALTGPFAPGPAAAPSFAPSGGTYTTPQTVTMSCSTPFAQIRYTTDGSEPSPSSALYSAPVSVGTTTTLKARAYRVGLTSSPRTTATYQMSFGQLPAPTFTPGPGTYVDPFSVAIGATAGATVRYTTDGSTPTTSSAVYAGPVPLSQTSTLKAKAWRVDYTESSVASGTYTVRVASPLLSHPSATYSAGTLVTLTAPTAGSTLHYSLDGVDPDASDPTVASGGRLVVGNYTLKVRAFKSGCNPSDVTAATYTVTGALTAGSVAAGDAYSMALAPDGTVWAWGANGYGQLGDGTTTSRTLPTSVAGLTGVTLIAAGHGHGLARKADGTLWAWGLNANGQLGDGTQTNRPLPVQVPGLSGIAALAGGSAHSVAVKSDGTVWSWGLNSSGQLGDGTTTQRLTPVRVSGVAGATLAVAGATHSLALLSDGTARAWGGNTYGQLGDGTTTSRTSPVSVSALGSVGGLGAGQSQSLAAKANGTGWVWGYGASPQYSAPQQVPALSGVASIVGGWYHAMALASGGSVWSWGGNLYGQLGDGTTTPKTTPSPVPGIAGIARIAVGPWHSIALASDGTIWAWGYNSSGQIGDGTTYSRTSPVKVADGGFSWKVATPTLSIPSGGYTATQTVVVSTATPAATITYTTNGADPLQTDSTVASGGSVVVGQSLTLKARAWKSGLASSNVQANTYTLTVATPTMSPAPGTYDLPQNVTLACSVAGATIRYTTDGTEPTGASAIYSTPVAIGSTATLKAKAFKSGWTDSAVGAGVYTMKVGRPAFSPGTAAYTGAQTVTVSTVTPGATIHYTTNGLEPSTSDPSVTSGQTVAVSRSLTLKARAVKTGWTPSDTGFASYWIAQGSVATPSMSPAPGSFTGTVTVTLATTTAGAVVRYTTDGTTPTLSSPAYGAALTLNDTTTIRAIGFKADFLPSSVASGSYTRTTAAVATPTLQPGSGNYRGAVSVTASCSTPGATIHYTTNGLDPTPSDASVSSGSTIQVTRSLMLKVRAFKSGMGNSAVRRGNYSLNGAIAAGGYAHSLALKSDGSVWAWGYNNAGQLGDGTTTQRLSPVQVSGLSGGVAVAAGTSHSLTLKADGTVWGWGSNVYGQLGDGTTINRTLPVQVSGLSGVVAIAAGDSFSMAVKADGTVWTWGSNWSGQLGDGTTTQRLSPVKVVGLTGVTRAAAGADYAVALKTDGASKGSVWTWGGNTTGQLGDGSGTARAVPVRVLEDATSIGASSASGHTLAVGSDGRGWAWGYNLSGQLGDGTSIGRPSPVKIVDSTGPLEETSAGANFSLARTEDDIVWSWGSNGNGQLGDGTGNGRVTPGFVQWLDHVVAAQAGYAFAVALRNDGSVWTWGYNSNGQLGDGSTTQRLRPVQVLDTSDNTWLETDSDQDGLSNRRELQLGTDPLNRDTNGDGVADGAQAGNGSSATDLDVDGDGLSNSAEVAGRTDPFRADTDGDGINDSLDCFPVDFARHQCPAPTPGDTTPPVITLVEPVSAVLIGSNP